jgi:hypothetical protein
MESTHGTILIDRTGIVRWVFVEAADGPAGMGKYPPQAELVTAAQTLLRCVCREKASIAQDLIAT